MWAPGCDEGRKVGCKATLVGDAIEGELFAGQPGVGGPVPGVAARGCAERQWGGNGEGKERGNLG